MAKESVTLRRGITREGVQYQSGDKVDVQDWEKRQLIASGYVDGKDEDTAPTEDLKKQYKEAAKGWEKRSDMDVFSIEKTAEDGDGYGRPDDAPEGAQEAQKQG